MILLTPDTSDVSLQRDLRFSISKISSLNLSWPGLHLKTALFPHITDLFFSATD